MYSLPAKLPEASMLCQIIAWLDDGVLPANRKGPCLQPAGTSFPIMPPSVWGSGGWGSGIITVAWHSLLRLRTDLTPKHPIASAIKVGFQEVRWLELEYLLLISIISLQRQHTHTNVGVVSTKDVRSVSVINVTEFSVCTISRLLLNSQGPYSRIQFNHFTTFFQLWPF